MEGQQVVDWELALLDRALAVIEGLLSSEDETIRLQAAKSVIRLVEVAPPAEILATPGEREAAEKWRGWCRSLADLGES